MIARLALCALAAAALARGGELTVSDAAGLQAALDAAGSDGAVIHLRPGIYRQVFVIAKPHIQLRGADTIRVTDLSIDGADNGIRIKSNSGRGGRIGDVVYDDVCIRDTKYPIFMDSDYAHYGKSGANLPWFTGIVLRHVRVMGAGRVTL